MDDFKKTLKRQDNTICHGSLNPNCGSTIVYDNLPRREVLQASPSTYPLKRNTNQKKQSRLKFKRLKPRKQSRRYYNTALPRSTRMCDAELFYEADYKNRNIKEEARRSYVEITEQPLSKSLRFRYICEGRSAGSIPGVHSTPNKKTYPSIKVVNTKGPAEVIVSCVTVEDPHFPHPHNLVGKEGCADGVCRAVIQSPNMEYTFHNLGVQCVKKRDVEASLSKRQAIQIDPLQTGFLSKKQAQLIDLNAIRLCFQVSLLDERTGEKYPLTPVLSDPIHDKKSTSDLKIHKLSTYSSSVAGGKEVILLCEKVTRDDIQVRFSQIKEDGGEWEAYGSFNASDVHKQVAISFITPRYFDQELSKPVNVSLQLFRPSDGNSSVPIPFEFYPMAKEASHNFLVSDASSGNEDADTRYSRNLDTFENGPHYHSPLISNPNLNCSETLALSQDLPQCDQEVMSKTLKVTNYSSSPLIKPRLLVNYSTEVSLGHFDLNYGDLNCSDMLEERRLICQSPSHNIFPIKPVETEYLDSSSISHNLEADEAFSYQRLSPLTESSKLFQMNIL